MKKLSFFILLFASIFAYSQGNPNGNGGGNSNGNQNPPGQSNQNNPNAPQIVTMPNVVACGEAVLNAGCDYEIIEWNNDPTNNAQEITVTQSGTYTVKVGYGDFYYFKEFDVEINQCLKIHGNCPIVLNTLDYKLAAGPLQPGANTNFYRFTFTSAEGDVLEYVTSIVEPGVGGDYVKLNLSTQAINGMMLSYETTYTVTVASSVDGSAGSWSSESEPCTIEIGAPPSAINIDSNASIKFNNEQSKSSNKVYNVNFSKSLITAYPNPADKGEVNIAIGTEKPDSKISLVIIDAYGKEVYSNKNAKPNQKVDVSGFKSGIYLIQGSVDNKPVTQKLIIE